MVGEVKERMDNVKRAKYLSGSVLCRTILVVLCATNRGCGILPDKSLYL